MKAIVRYMGKTEGNLIHGAFYEISGEISGYWETMIDGQKWLINKALSSKWVTERMTAGAEEYLENSPEEPKIELNKEGFFVDGRKVPTGGDGGEIKDIINKPDHYHKGGFDIYEILQAKFSPEWYRGFCMGNVIKYDLRHEMKGGVEDLKKARFNQDRLIESYEGVKYIPDHKKKQGSTNKY